MHVRRGIRAISPVLAVLMMIAVSIAGALVVYAWIMGYIGVSTERAGEAIMIQSIANHEADLMVYVQNIGEGVAQLEEDTCLYVNGILVSCSISKLTVSDGIASLSHGDTAALAYSGGAAFPGQKVTVKVTTLLGTFAEKTAYPAGSARASPVLDHFIFDYVESPQTAGLPFNVTIRTIDQYGKPLTSYNGSIVISYVDGDTQYHTGLAVLNGVKRWDVTFTDAATDVSISVTAWSDTSKNGTSNSFDVVDSPSPSKEILFEDDFESYGVGTFPYSGGWQLWYDGRGDEYQFVVNNVSNSPTKSLKLLGVSGWAAYSAKPIDTDSPLIGFTVSVRVESLRGGNRDIARVGFATILPPNRATSYAPIRFTDYGTIYVMGEGDLQSYVADRWYKVTVIMDRNAEIYSLWIDDELVGKDLPVYTNRGPLEAGETSWDIEAFAVSQNYHSTNAYFDDVHIFYVL